MGQYDYYVFAPPLELHSTIFPSVIKLLHNKQGLSSESVSGVRTKSSVYTEYDGLFPGYFAVSLRSSELLKVHQREIHHLEGLFFAVTQLLHST